MRLYSGLGIFWCGSGHRRSTPCAADRFRRAGVVDGHHDRTRFRWELATEGGPVVAKGTDFATVAARA